MENITTKTTPIEAAYYHMRALFACWREECLLLRLPEGNCGDSVSTITTNTENTQQKEQAVVPLSVAAAPLPAVIDPPPTVVAMLQTVHHPLPPTNHSRRSTAHSCCSADHSCHSAAHNSRCSTSHSHFDIADCSPFSDHCCLTFQSLFSSTINQKY